eukprot:8578210-Karenia_brevis.AAC.1
MFPPGSCMDRYGSVQDPESVIFASFRPKVAKMTPAGPYMGPGGSVQDPERIILYLHLFGQKLQK